MEIRRNIHEKSPGFPAQPQGVYVQLRKILLTVLQQQKCINEYELASQ
jgi:hypothetical protein